MFSKTQTLGKSAPSGNLLLPRPQEPKVYEPQKSSGILKLDDSRGKIQKTLNESHAQINETQILITEEDRKVI